MNYHTAGTHHETAAFFDLDGTLLPAPSLEWRFIEYLLEHSKISLRQFARGFATFGKFCLHDLQAASEGNKAYLVGLPESLFTDWEHSLLPRSLAPFARGLQRIRWHLAQQHRIFFVSGTLEPLAQVAARHAATLIRAANAPGFSAHIEVCATRLVTREGRWTGDIAGEHCSGKAKACALRVLAAEHGLDLQRSFAYGNGIGDVPMLAAVGFGMAINPSTRLERAARVRGWKICDWKEISAPPRHMRHSDRTQRLYAGGAE